MSGVNDHSVNCKGWIEFTRKRSLADFSAPNGERQKHFGALNGALATGFKAPGLWGKNQKTANTNTESSLGKTR
jgi:hypothetical protein